MSDFNANSVGLDWMPDSAAFDLGLHCLPKFLLWDTKRIWVNARKAVDSFDYSQTALEKIRTEGKCMDSIPVFSKAITCKY